MYSSLLELLGGDAMLLWLNMKIFFYLVGIVHPKKNLLQSLSVFFKKMWSDFLSYSCVTFW